MRFPSRAHDFRVHPDDSRLFCPNLTHICVPPRPNSDAQRSIFLSIACCTKRMRSRGQAHPQVWTDNNNASPHPLLLFAHRFVSQDILPHLKYAWVWGSSVKHQPMKTGKDHRLNDEDVVQIVKKV